MSNETELDFTKPLEYVSPDGRVQPFSLLFSNGRGDYSIGGYVGESSHLSFFMLDGRTGRSSLPGYLRNVKRKPRQWYTWASMDEESQIGANRYTSAENVALIGLAKDEYIVRVTEVLPEEE